MRPVSLAGAATPSAAPVAAATRAQSRRWRWSPCSSRAAAWTLRWSTATARSC